MSAATEKQQQGGMLPSRYAGGPHNLGDPNDRSMRKVEKEVLVPQIMRRIAQTELCVNEMRNFHECYGKAQLLFSFKCREENKVMSDCLIGWFKNEEFRQRCTDIYLDERSEYRRTGLKKKVREFIKLRDEGKITIEDLKF